MREPQENKMAPQQSPVFTPEPQDFLREHRLSLPCSAGAKPDKMMQKPTNSRLKTSGSRGWNRSQCGSGTAHGAVWFQWGLVITHWHRTTQLQNRIGTTRRNARKSSARLAVSGLATATAINGNSAEFGPYGSTLISSVVPVNICSAHMEPHGKT